MEEKKLTWREKEKLAFKNMVLHYSSEIKQLKMLVEEQSQIIDLYREIVINASEIDLSDLNIITNYQRKIKRLEKQLLNFTCTPN